MDGKTLARLGALVFVALAATVTAIELTWKDERPNNSPTQVGSKPERDPLDTALARCGALGEAGARDPACLKTWSDNRRRFLGEER